jgi:hypothetical protein
MEFKLPDSDGRKHRVRAMLIGFGVAVALVAAMLALYPS